MKSAKQHRAEGRARLMFPTPELWHKTWANWVCWRFVRSYQASVKKAHESGSITPDEEILAGYFRRALLMKPPERPPLRDVKTKREEGDERTIAGTKPTSGGKRD